jgi:pentatricopeptide repeat protein
VSTYTALINGHVTQDNLNEAFRFHDEMLQRGFAPDDVF